MCLGSICCGSAHGRIEISDNRVNAFTNGTALKAHVVSRTIFKWHQFLGNCFLYLPATWMQALPPSREKGEQTVLADSYGIVLQPLIWISYGHPIRRFSPVRSYVVEGVIDFHGNPWCV